MFARTGTSRAEQKTQKFHGFTSADLSRVLRKFEL